VEHQRQDSENYQPCYCRLPYRRRLWLLNTTHALAGNFSGPPVLFADFLAQGQGFTDKTYVLYPWATVFMSLPADMILGIGVTDPATELKPYDLVTGLPLPAVLTNLPDGSAIFKVESSIG